MFPHAALKAEPDVTMAAFGAAEVAASCDSLMGTVTNKKLPDLRLFPGLPCPGYPMLLTNSEIALFSTLYSKALKGLIKRLGAL